MPITLTQTATTVNTGSLADDQTNGKIVTKLNE